LEVGVEVGLLDGEGNLNLVLGLAEGADERVLARRELEASPALLAGEAALVSGWRVHRRRITTEGHGEPRRLHGGKTGREDGKN
jgi:hypothetical protein